MDHVPPKPGIFRIDVTPRPPKAPCPFDIVSKQHAWKDEVQRLLAAGSVTPELSSIFHTRWTVEGHRIREQVADDQLLTGFLQMMMPKYQGEEVRLYRGENIDRYRCGAVGFCWTTFRPTAEMFGVGLNATRSGGLLLAVSARPSWIIAGPSDHSRKLDEHEHTVQPDLLMGIEILAEYPSSDSPGERHELD